MFAYCSSDRTPYIHSVLRASETSSRAIDSYSKARFASACFAPSRNLPSLTIAKEVRLSLGRSAILALYPNEPRVQLWGKWLSSCLQIVIDLQIL